MSSSNMVYESLGGPDLVAKFNDTVARLAASVTHRRFTWRRRFDSVSLLWNKDLSLVAGAFSAKGGVDQQQARKGVPEIVTKFLRLSGHVPPPDALQVHMRGMLLFIERGSYLTLVADILAPMDDPWSKQSIHGLDMLVNRNAYKCIFETTKDAPLDLKITLDREFSERFKTEFQNAVDFAPSLRVMLADIEKRIFRRREPAEKPTVSPEIQRLLEVMVVE